MRAFPLLIGSLMLLTTACSKGAPACTGITNGDPPFCLNVPAADYKVGTVNKYAKGGQMSISGLTPDKGSFLISWYPADDYENQVKTSGYTKKSAKVDGTGVVPGGKGEWFTYNYNGAKSVNAVIKTDKAVVVCSGSAGATSASLNQVLEACKTLH